MDRLGTLIYTNSWGYTVYAVVMKDINSSRVSIELYVVSPDDEMSDIITLPRKDIYTKKNCFDFFYDMDGDFARDDIDKIKNEVMKILRSGMETDQKRATMEELHVAVSRFVKDNVEDLKDNPEAEVFIKDGYGYIKTSKMNAFIKDGGMSGYKRQDILKRLKIMGVLEHGKDRPYDILVSINNNKRRCYKILLAKKTGGEEKADEVVSVAD